jgi:hypothetical protein
MGARFRDLNANNQWDTPDQTAIVGYGWAGAVPVVGRWKSPSSGLMAAEG